MSSANTPIEAALNGQYVFNIKALLRYSHDKTKAQIFPFIGAMVLAFAAVVVFSMILLSVFEISNPLEIERATVLQLEMLLIFFMAPIITAFLVMGIRSAMAKPIKPLDMLANISNGLMGFAIAERIPITKKAVMIGAIKKINNISNCNTVARSISSGLLISKTDNRIIENTTTAANANTIAPINGNICALVLSWE